MLKRLHSSQNFSLISIILFGVLIFITGRVFLDGFGTVFSIRAMLILASFLAIAALGQTLVILLGGIDMSIPFLIGFANVAAAKLYGDGMQFPLVVIIILGLAIIIGLLNGVVASYLRIHPLIITLGIGTIIQGCVLSWTKGFPTGSAPDYLTKFVSIGGSMGPIPFPPVIVLWLLFIIIIEIILRRTIFGRHVYATGTNKIAASLALVNPVLIWAITFGLSALFASIAGILLLGFTGSAYGDVGVPYLFQSISAVLIGGASLLGGKGTYWRTSIGAFILIELTTVLIGFGIKAELIQAVVGIMIIVFVSIYGRELHVRNTI